ncbi:hypothetical protein F4861DRAFT_513924 [Xylaria intraflava]|nr:hypothetical protein F4861DRAFT_513924 [Xylaria intraflava]
MTLTDVVSPTKGLGAAKWAIQAKNRNAVRRHPLRPTHSTNVRAKALSVRDIANRHNLPPATVAKELKALREGKPDGRSAKRRGRPSTLTDSEDRALSLYVSFMNKGTF